MRSLRALLRTILLTLLCTCGAFADEVVHLTDLEASRLSADGFLALVQEFGVRAICDVDGVRDCLNFSQARCQRDLERQSPRCMGNVRRLIQVTGVTGDQLNPTYLADYASCVINNAAAIQMLDLDAVHGCLVQGSLELARLWNGERE